MCTWHLCNWVYWEIKLPKCVIFNIVGQRLPFNIYSLSLTFALCSSLSPNGHHVAESWMTRRQCRYVPPGSGASEQGKPYVYFSFLDSALGHETRSEPPTASLHIHLRTSFILIHKYKYLAQVKLRSHFNYAHTFAASGQCSSVHLGRPGRT